MASYAPDLNMKFSYFLSCRCCFELHISYHAGYKAFRGKKSGTCFIRTLVYVFNQYSHMLHLTDMLTKVCSHIYIRLVVYSNS